MKETPRLELLALYFRKWENNITELLVTKYFAL
jgi:hypothetical protein